MKRLLAVVLALMLIGGSVALVGCEKASKSSEISPSLRQALDRYLGSNSYDIVSVESLSYKSNKACLVKLDNQYILLTIRQGEWQGSFWYPEGSFDSRPEI